MDKTGQKMCGNCALWEKGETGGWGDCRWATWRKPPLMPIPYANRMRSTRHFEGKDCPAWEEKDVKVERTGPPEPAKGTFTGSDPEATGTKT